jgi:hypothetical protein
MKPMSWEMAPAGMGKRYVKTFQSYNKKYEKRLAVCKKDKIVWGSKRLQLDGNQCL